MANILTSATNLVSSVYSIPERESQVGYIRTAANFVSSLKVSATEQVTSGAMHGIRALGLHTYGGMPMAEACARKFYGQTGAKSVVSAVASSTLHAVTSCDFVKGKLGQTGSDILYFIGAGAGQIAEEVALDACAARVFHPLISLLREKVIETQVRGCVNIAIDTGLILAAGHLGAVAKVATVASKVATCANIGALAYVYAPPVVHCGKAILQCCSIKSKMAKIKKSLNHISLQPLLPANISEDMAKKTLSTLLAIVIENGGLSQTISLDILFEDEKMLASLVNIVAAALT